jgi:Uncharacterized conserved protein (some members contain a von Willebrand factor type A (vWA) domain)
MLKTWFLYSISLIAAFIFFLFYKMWLSWYILIALLAIPVFALIVTITASLTVKFSVVNPAVTVKGKPAFIKLSIEGIASAFSFYKVKMITTDHMAGTQEKKVIVICDNGVTKIPLETDHCGAYSYKLSKLKVYDLLGFFHFDQNINKDIELLVKPSPEMPGYMPDMYGFKAKNLRKSSKPNSEIYDIRDYQLGDPVKTIHWKMSAKKDKYLVKEPLEEYGGYSRVILKMTDDRDELDLHLGQILFTSKFFIDHEVAHIIRVIPPDSREVAFSIESNIDLERALHTILHMRIPEEASEDKRSTEEPDEEEVLEEVSDAD